MNDEDLHPYYGKILEALVAMDHRTILPPAADRLDTLASFVADDSEKNTEIVTIDPSEYD